MKHDGPEPARREPRASRDGQQAREPKPGRRNPHRRACWALFLGLLAIYHSNDAIVEEGDAVANLGIPIALLRDGRLSFTPDTHPEMFNWRALAPMTPRDDVFVRSWHWVVDKDFAYRWREQGLLELGKPRYFAVESPVHPGTFVSTFGPIPGLTMLPLIGALMAIDKRFPEKNALKWSAAKLFSAGLVAGSAVLIYLISLGVTSSAGALLLAWAYGLGTCVWTISSQTLWQQTVNFFFLLLSVYLLRSPPLTVRRALMAGLAMGTAVACRHTSLLVLAPLGLYLIWRDRARVIPFSLGILPLPLFVAAYNYHYFGNPMSFAQELVGHEIAIAKTGSPDIWQTPMWEGFVGLMFSPSRGVMVFSPFLVLAGWGVVRIFRRREFEWLRPLCVGVVAIMALQCKWFDWWGGWSYGYRPWLDAVPFLVLFMGPIVDSILSRGWSRALFGMAIGWSIAIQALGAFAYDKNWNARQMFLVEMPDGERKRVYDNLYEARALAQIRGGRVYTKYHCNVDEQPCRYRLWSLEDNVLTYYIKNFGQARRHRWPSGWLTIRY